ncbi:xylulokinase [Reyranella sp.]|jgi:xylulokinase|uniref:xylulokinase n=1 Tax=Reyranella sp. TaxID=1929291 RepID=UPI002F937C88
MYLGIDIGTSGVKAIVMDERDQPVAQTAAPLSVSRPRPLWAEQAPEDWWRAVEEALDSLAARSPEAMAAVRAVGLSGQMLGVTLLDGADRPLRPALLWNDGRATAEGAELEQRFPDFAERVGCRAMPGFSAPKILWLARHEPASLARARQVLLTKDYIRLRLTGEAASDRADSSATLLMDTRAGDWLDGLLAACGIGRAMLPRLVDSAETAGIVRPHLAARWHLPKGTPLAGGGGDNMCAGIGVGAVHPGDAYIGLGTSGVYFVANDRFIPATSAGMHTHRHAVAGLFCQHAVVLSAGASLAWVGSLLRAPDLAGLMAEVEAAKMMPAETPVFTPYLGGERTPHDDPTLTATFSGLTHQTGPLALVQAVMEGVALAVADGHGALIESGAPIGEVSLTGGGARSALWASLVAAALGIPLRIQAEAQAGPALGAARLARQSIGGPLLASSSASATLVPVETSLREQLLQKRMLFRKHLDLSR